MIEIRRSRAVAPSLRICWRPCKRWTRLPSALSSRGKKQRPDSSLYIRDSMLKENVTFLLPYRSLMQMRFEIFSRRNQLNVIHFCDAFGFFWYSFFWMFFSASNTLKVCKPTRGQSDGSRLWSQRVHWSRYVLLESLGVTFYARMSHAYGMS